MMTIRQNNCLKLVGEHPAFIRFRMMQQISDEGSGLIKSDKMLIL